MSLSSLGANDSQQSLESFDDLIQKQQQQASSSRSRSSSIGTIMQNNTSNGNALIEQDNDSADSAYTIKQNPDESIQSKRNRSRTNESNSTIRASTSQVSNQHRDESRFNGFHLWRAESYQRRVELENANEQRRRRSIREQESRPIVGIIWSKIKNWFITSMAYNTNTSDGSEDVHTIKMICLTIVLAGVQFAWALEYAYGTPYLISIGVNPSNTSLIWLAAPLSGLLVQPIIGAISDADISNWKRRKYIVASTVILVGCIIILAFSNSISENLADILHLGLGDWDPHRKRACKDINILIAITGFVGLDISVNGLQASSRALLFDSIPSNLQTRANTWSTRMLLIGSCLGYGFGWLSQSKRSTIGIINEFQNCCFTSILGIIICSTITCLTIKETSSLHSSTIDVSFAGLHYKEIFSRIWQTIRRLPRSIRRICLAQMFAFSSWFTFLFYSSEWILEINKNENSSKENGLEIASFALLSFSIVSLITNLILPFFTLANWKSKGSEFDQKRNNNDNNNNDEENNDTNSIIENEEIPDSIDDISRPLLSNSNEITEKPPIWRLTLKTFWFISLCWLGLLLSIITFFIKTTKEAIILISLIGISWSIALLVPYALIMENIYEAQDGESPFEFYQDWFAPTRVQARKRQNSEQLVANEAMSRARINSALEDCSPLGSNNVESIRKVSANNSIVTRGGLEVRGASSNQTNNDEESVLMPSRIDVIDNQDVGGTILGIHNISIVIPQLFMALISKGILQSTQSLDYQSNSSIVWLLRFGGLIAFIAASIVYFVPLSRTERKLLKKNETLFTLPFQDEIEEQ